MVKHCTLHILNLGLLHISNGGVLRLGYKSPNDCIRSFVSWKLGQGILMEMKLFGDCTTREGYKEPLKKAYANLLTWRKP